MSVSPPGHWLLNRMVFLLNRTLGIINTRIEEAIVFLLKNQNTFTGIDTFMGGIRVDNINSINGNTTFNSEIIVNSNITANNGTFIGDNLLINNIYNNNTGESITFKNNINMNSNDIDNINNLTSGNLYIDDISIKTSSSPYIIVNNDIKFNDGIIVNGDLVVNGTTTSVNSQTLTINDRFIILNANLSNVGLAYTDPAGIIVQTHNSSQYSSGYLLWTLFDPNDLNNIELNRTWDLSGDNLRGNVLKATTLRGNIIDSYYSPNISVISDIDMNNNDISNINILTAKELNIDNISTNTAANISVFNTIDMNNNYIINANIAALNHSQINVENGLITTQTLTLSHTNIYETNNFNLGATHGISVIGDTQLNIWKGNNVANFTLFLPENNGETTNNGGTITGGNQQKHTQSILGIGAFYKRQNSLQSFNNSQCYLIPPSMISSDIPELKGNTLFETIGQQNGNIKYLAGYPTANIGINELRNTLVPTVGQIVDLLNYLGVHMNGNQSNLVSTY